jgi:hypothetical protein
LAVLHEAEGDRPERQAREEVRGPVDGVDGPEAFGRLAAVFFAQDGAVGEGFCQTLAERLFDGAVGRRAARLLKKASDWVAASVRIGVRVSSILGPSALPDGA